MNKITAVIIAKNAENLIVDCIESISFCDEIIVIDNTSIDRTADVAKKMHAKVISTDTQSFAEQRNIGLAKAKGKWILYIDTDERVTPELAHHIQTISTTPSDKTFVAYRLIRQNFYFGNHPWPRQEKLERLFEKKYLKEWYGALHESPKVEGEIGQLDGLLLHYTHRDLTSMLEKTIQWSKIEAELRYNAHHPTMSWWRFFRVIATGFYDSYILQEGWRAGTVGIIESVYQAFSIFVTYARLWEMQNRQVTFSKT